MRFFAAAVTITAIALSGTARRGQADLIGHWTLDNDTTGIQNQGTNGAPSNMAALGTMPVFNATGGYDGGGYANFSGTQSLVATTAGNAATVLGAAGYPFTFAAWIRLPAPVTTTGRGTIMSLSTTTSSGDFMTMSVGYSEDRDFEANRRFGGTTNLIDADGSASIITNGVWHHVAAVYGSPSSLDLYVDGVLQTLNPAVTPVTFPTTVNAVGIGVFQRNNATPATDRFRGDIDDARLYNTALSAQEVAVLAVPEPHALLLIIFGGIGLWGARRRGLSS